MDQLEAWAVRGRIATAVRSVHEALTALALSSRELRDAMTEAVQLGICDTATPETESRNAA
ncbi:hypothetical protein KGQ20_15900 [Catenulispora sp. NF23]|uniref:ANTAR domain-containing protein n=1 Tax=Catenulispora pinistramenti TaxID=2705254 RepID=A0ABS5KXN0_9ACTN|nr:hypothetical protein [Catenulispora pinistramenti]MBS2534254.1 hypothetical protein [Catenulispora pinistramenti]MBS2550818.1 hypothetical protein [Catenulispora pinistramenti]